ncbi:Seryl-tRNA synthetase [Ceratobasidium theobromae]|uniref:Seryl-tRNA synthetase n=1 Tax=Ceratobasidium theobromae TaxID=1582974 RepID=A0A5N5QA06_9AGAM|nr:Seryl-tRNA synthetase [Ceratobasidium theobromae]
MTFSPRHSCICRRLIQSYSSKPNALSKRPVSSGILPPPKLNYEDLIHPSQPMNAKHRNANVPERTFVALRRDLNAWRTTNREADELRARQSAVGETIRTPLSPEGQYRQ